MDKKILGWLLAAALAVAGFVVSKSCWVSLGLTEPWGTTRVTVVDTVPYYKPVPRDSVVVRYERVKLPIGDGRPSYASVSLTKPGDTILAESYAHKSAENIPDSVRVEIPITQKRYGDSTYTAWVSGYDVQLDSIYVYPKHEYVTRKVKEPPNRWHIGLTAGYGFCREGVQPFVGIGVTYSLISF